MGALAAGALAIGTLAGGAAHAAAPTRAPAVAKAAKAAKAPCTLKRIRACVSLSRQRAWLMRGGKVVYGPVRIASGRPGYRTSHGLFRVTFKDLHHRSHKYHGAPMPYSVFFHGGEAFHEGDPYVQSHGCIHLTHYSAKRFYSYLHKGDYVRVR